MKYNFDKIIDRKNTGSWKWDTTELIFGSDAVLPMWVADMDFPIAKPIIDALKKRIDHGIFGYTMPWDSLIKAVVDRVEQKYNWKIEPEWIVFTPGVIPAIYSAIKAFTHPGDDVILQGPVYYPFWDAIKDNGCNVSNNQLKLVNTHYEMNFEDLEKKFAPRPEMIPSPPRARMMILCNPHNPVGRVWSKKELKKAGEIVLKHDAIVISDEIHCELLLTNSTHTPFATISKEFEQHSITCMAPSKTFNLAGLEASSIIIPNEDLRNKFNIAKEGITLDPNALGLVALEAAYRNGDEWLSQLLDYLRGNLEFLMKYFEEKIPQVKVAKPEGTYLVWLDFRKLGMNNEKLSAFLRQKAKVGLDDGYLFGPSGSGFERINIACPRSILKEGLKRIEKAINNL
ncbi:MAG: MalY/PatB family protein [Caldisericota bacterium]|nr:MalY/PatB family protein [Caldisericota bacterium]